MVLITIGIAIIFLGVGLFLGKMLNKEFFDKIKQRQQEKLKQKEIRRELELNAREEALKNMYPELVKKKEQEEINKLTGQYKKDKLEKFSKMFNMGGQGQQDGSFSQNKINNMLGNSGFNTDPNKILGNTNTPNNENKINNMLGNSGFNTDPNKILGNTTPNNDDKVRNMLGTTGLNTDTNKILGTKQTQEEKETEEERIKKEKIKRIIGI